MNIRALIQHWQHRRKAKGRHGTHSPFVYRFIEEALKPALSKALKQQLRGGKTWGEHTTALLYRCLKFLQPETIEYAMANTPEFLLSIIKSAGVPTMATWTAYPAPMPADGIIIAAPPGEMLKLFNERAGLLACGSFMIITDIYATPQHITAWQEICADERVNLSLDMYFAGLLFYRKDFREKQRFQLKYPV